MGDMKEIRDAALAYYRNLSKEQQQAVYTFLKKMDADGDGAITIKEFKQILGISFGDTQANCLFRDMDKNGDGILDFEEAITFVYVCINNRMISCDGCKASFLKGLYFTCVDCFEPNKPASFDLCISCFGSRNYVHEHCNFLDNYALLRTKSASTSTNQPASSLETVAYDPEDDPQSKTGAVLRAISTTIEIGNVVGNVDVISGLCVIM